MKTNLKNATKRILPTSGEIFPDGAMIELVCGPVGSTRPQLLLWNSAVTTLSQRVKYGDSFYEPAHMPLGIYRATRLPARYEDHQSVAELFNRIQKLFNEHLHFGERESRLLAAFSMSTWVADRLPCAPGVVISSFSQALGVELLKLLSCVCRRPLLLAEVTPASFRALPMELFLTLLISQAAPRPALLRLVGASQHRGMHLLGKGGSVTDVYGPKVILGGTDALAECFSESMIQISMAQAQARRTVLDEPSSRESPTSFNRNCFLTASRRLRNCASRRWILLN